MPSGSKGLAGRESLVTRGRLERPKGWVPPRAMVVVDPNCLGPDIKLRWVNKFVTATEIDGRFFDALQRGWVPVKEEELPQYKTRLRDPSGEGYLFWKGCILCKIDAKIAQLDVEYYEDLALGQLAGAQGEFLSDDNGNKAVPKVVEANKMQTFRGRRPPNT